MTTVATAVRELELYDTHAHFFTDDFDRYPVNTANAREGEDHLRQRILSNPALPDGVLRTWDESNVVGGVGVQYQTIYKTDNRYALDVSDQHPSRISCVVMLDASAADTPALLESYITGRGITGLRLYGPVHPDGSLPWLDSPAALKTWEVADRYGLNVVVMYVPALAAAVACPRIAALARRFPATRISLDHFGWAGTGADDEGLPPPLLALREIGTIFYKLTTINFHRMEQAQIDSARFLRRAADAFGADHLMWGSDLGNTLEDFPEMARRARKAAALLAPSECRQFLCETGRTLFARPAGR